MFEHLQGSVKIEYHAPATNIVEYVTLNNNSNCESETVEKNFSLVSDISHSFDLQLLKDPNKWPAISGKLRILLVQSGPYQIHLKSYPKDYKGRRFTTHHFFRKLSNVIEINRS